MRTFVLVMAGLVVVAFAGCTGQGESSPRDRLPAQNQVADRYVQSLGVDLDSMEMRFNGLHLQDLEAGGGARVDSGDVVTVHYTGWLPNGQKFDSSRDRDAPFEVALGYGRVIPGWDQGLIGMREGGRRLLVIPPALAYGTRRQGPIPANSTLVFDVEVLEVENRTPESG